MAESDIFDLTQLNFGGDFDHQLNYILNHIRLTREEVEELQILFDDLEMTLKKEWPNCRIQPFGSVVTGLAIKSSDLDIYVDIPGKHDSHVANQTCVKLAKKMLSRRTELFDNLCPILKAKVPILKFVYQPLNIECDISFSSSVVIDNSRLINYLMSFDDRVLPLTVIIKYWSKIHILSGTNLIPNYCLIIMIIFFLQQEEILPSVHQIQSGSKMIDTWNTSFNSTPIRPLIKNNSTVYSLLGKFFKFYLNFRHDQYVISPYLGQAIKKSCFQDVRTVPNEFNLYKHNVQHIKATPLKIDTCYCIQDPFIHNRNCSVCIFPKMEIRILAYFDDASRKFDQCHRNEFLEAILTNGPDGVPPSGKIQNQGPKIIIMNQGRIVKRKNIKHPKALNNFKNNRKLLRMNKDYKKMQSNGFRY